MLQLTKWLNIKNSSTILCISKCLEQIAMIKTKKKKNGAHKHLSHLKKLRASKYSRHVVLCKNAQKPQNNKNIRRRKTPTSKKIFLFHLMIIVCDDDVKIERSGNFLFIKMKKTKLIQSTNYEKNDDNHHLKR